METDFEKGIGAPVGEGRPVAPISESNAALDIIRTETVFSKLPVHNLSKKGSISIHITKKTGAGQIDLLWKVSPSRDYGEPRQLAYKLDTILINDRIDQIGRPLPKTICLGSVSQLCKSLGMPPSGKNISDVKLALRQNAFVGITAKFKYKGNDGTEQDVDANDTRYGVVFTGEKLPGGKRADAVYLLLHEFYWDVLNKAPIRPLDRTYMKELPPAAQRFYEIVSYKIFSALKYNHLQARLLYSEYCTYSAQHRNFELWKVKRQMTPIHNHHLKSSYLHDVHYEETTDTEGKPDWVMLYTPGARARAQYTFFSVKKSRAIDLAAETSSPTQAWESHRRSVPRQRRLKFESVPQTIQVTMPTVTMQPAPEVAIDPEILSALTNRGITETTARELITNLKPGQNILDQLEWGEHQVARNPVNFSNPAGFLISLIRENITVPATFETSGQRKVREEEERQQRLEREQREESEREYEAYKQTEREHYLQNNVDPAELSIIKQGHAKRLRAQYRSLDPRVIDQMSESDARNEIGERASILSFEEFSAQRKLQKTAPEMAGQQSGESAITPILLLSPPSEPGR